MTELKSNCHCGLIAIRYTLPQSDQAIIARRCSCSYCQSHGASYISHPDARLTIKTQRVENLLKYRFGTQTADFCLCRQCGVLLFACSNIGGRDYAVLNILCLNSVDREHISISDSNFDGEQTADRLDRRAQRWIGTVDWQFESS